jgi:riboflavin kinase/FMN adenylyltransferase
VITPNTLQPILTTFEEKAAILAASGIDYLVGLPFNAWYRGLSPADFARDVLMERYQAVEWVMGGNHTFGKNREGDTKFLHENSGGNHFKIFITSLNTEQSEPISSTNIRAAIIEGELERAVGWLGHPYLILACRIEGKKKGTELGIPTLNFRMPSGEKVIPPSGVYAAELEYDKRRIPGALYFGNCPTFGNRDLHFEFHALEVGHNFPAIDETAALWVHRFIRSDRRFSTPAELVIQMKSDISTIKTFFLQE